MRCTEGLGLPLAKVRCRLLMAAVLACLASLTLLASSALADDLPASDPRAASDPAAVPPADDPAPKPPAAPKPAPGPPATHPVHPVHPAPVVEPVMGPPVVQLPVDPGVPELPDPGATSDIQATTGDAATVDAKPSNGSPAVVASAPAQLDPVASEPTPRHESPTAAPDPAVVIPQPHALVPASWRWPSLASPSAGSVPVALTGTFLSGGPPVMAVPSTLSGDDGATAGQREGARHAPPAVRSQPAPWSPDAPGPPFSAGATPPASAAGGLGGWALACFLLVLLALAAPRWGLPRPALSPVVTLRPAYAPARAPPAS